MVLELTGWWESLSSISTGVMLEAPTVMMGKVERVVLLMGTMA